MTEEQYQEILAEYRAKFDALVARGKHPQRAEATVAQNVHTDYHDNPELANRLLDDVLQFVP